MAASVCMFALLAPRHSGRALVAMDTLTKDLRHRLLRILYFVCEAALVASFAANEVLWHTYHRAPRDASLIFGLTFLFSLATLLVVCFCLRRTARLLAIIGWITAFILFVFSFKASL